MMVKICGITNREDALAAIEAGATALGFNFWSGSPRYIDPESAGDLLALVPSHVWKVGLFVNELPQKVANLAARLGLDIVQLHGNQPPPEELRVWKAVQVTPAFTMDQLNDPRVDAFLLDAASGARHGGTGQTFDWNLVQTTARRIVLAGGLDASNVGQAIQMVRPWGVDACSRLESAPGRKDHRKMQDFIKAALS